MKKLIILLVAMSVFSSCTEEIDLNLNSSDPQIVAEASVAPDSYAQVSLTQSVDFDESNTFPAVQNALIRISDELGNTDLLTEFQPGFYMSDTLKGRTGGTYTLSIITSDKELSAQSTMPQPVGFDTLILQKTEGGGGGPGGGGPGGGADYEVWVRYTDPADRSNYYRFVEYVNGLPSSSVFVFDDRLTNGNAVEHRLMNFSRKLKPGDVVTVEMQSIDEPVYSYFNSFGNLGGGPQNASTPANPYTNINGSKLGYFSAHTVERRTVVVE